jgi:hypothetical protein
MTFSQICDFDLCNTCCELKFGVVSLGKLPSPRVHPLTASPFCSTFVASKPIVETINISSDDSPPRPKIHPFFIRRAAQLAEETHEMRFHALAKQPAPALPTLSPPRRATGRLKLRLLTPVFPPQIMHTASTPRRKKSSTPDCLSPQLAGLAISTLPRVGCPHFQPRLLFPDSPPSSVFPVESHQPISQRCDAAVQTDPQFDAFAPECSQPLTLQHFQNELQVLRNELRVLVIGFGF